MARYWLYSLDSTEPRSTTDSLPDALAWAEDMANTDSADPSSHGDVVAVLDTATDEDVAAFDITPEGARRREVTR